MRLRIFNSHCTLIGPVTLVIRGYRLARKICSQVRNDSVLIWNTKDMIYDPKNLNFSVIKTANLFEKLCCFFLVDHESMCRIVIHQLFYSSRLNILASQPIPIG